MATGDTYREEGVDFAEFNRVLEGLSFPVTNRELVEQYGDRQFERTNVGPITVAELFGPMGDDTFESVEEVREMVLSQMPGESVGRRRYSDRGVSNDTREGSGLTESESF